MRQTLNLHRTHLKNAFGLQSANFYSAIFSGLIVLSVRIVPAAMASQRNSLDFAFKAIFEMGSKQEGKVLGQDFAALFVLESSRDKGQNYMTFDVAVIVSQESKKSGGGGLNIKVASIGGEIGDIKSQEHISRIKFHIIPHITIG